ncbi:MgtC/SapB family protein [Selenomonas sp.]|uniref:MgtC/SapB family protein n=1 Tax=Selenomonas sp. TaxID=2053611 RepID=UPI003FA24F23
MVSEWEVFLRLTLSCVLGGVIGYERQSRRKSAGLRTNMLVCLGSCLVMLLSTAIYQGVEGRTNADPARLAAQVVSGIGFLGAGAIMKEGLTVTGLTTAACLWVVAGVGLATGGGYYTAALLATGLVFVTLGALSRIDEWVLHDNHILLTVFTRDLPGQLVHINECLEDLDLTVHTVKTVRSEVSDRALVLEFELFNHSKIKGVALADAVGRIEGVTGVNVA